MPENSDWRQLQEEAARRMREMQSRARAPQARPSQQSRRPTAQERPHPQPAPEPAPEPAPPQAPEPQPAPRETAAQAVSPLESLFQDKERTVILALLILLSGEEGNHELLFALMFLLL